jgi:hypothetical protein
MGMRQASNHVVGVLCISGTQVETRFAKPMMTELSAKIVDKQRLKFALSLSTYYVSLEEASISNLTSYSNPSRISS